MKDVIYYFFITSSGQLKEVMLVQRLWIKLGLTHGWKKPECLFFLFPKFFHVLLIVFKPDAKKQGLEKTPDRGITGLSNHPDTEDPSLDHDEEKRPRPDLSGAKERTDAFGSWTVQAPTTISGEDTVYLNMIGRQIFRTRFLRMMLFSLYTVTMGDIQSAVCKVKWLWYFVKQSDVK